MSIRTESDFAGLRRVGRVVARTREEMRKRLRPGITTAELDEIGDRVLSRSGARSAPRLCYDFPGATCISVNDEVAHGIPGDRRIQRGDVVNIDVSAELDGFFADTGASYTVEPIGPRTSKLCRTARRALDDALHAMQAGGRISATGRAVERRARRSGLCAIRNLYAHGVGRWIHEEPLAIANVFVQGERRRFTDGLVVAMETFLSEGSPWVFERRDGWTLSTTDGSWAAQYEHTVVVTRSGPVVVTHP